MISYNTRLLYTMMLTGTLSMRLRFVMKDPVDGAVLTEAVRETTKIRYPYLMKKLLVQEEKFVYERNDLPVPVMETCYPLPQYGTKESNYHMILVDYEENRIFFNMCHNISAGRGMARWAFSCLVAYVEKKYGVSLKCDTIRRWDQPPQAGEDFVEPFTDLPDVERTWMGYPSHIRPVLPTQLETMLPGAAGDGLYETTFRLKSADVMQRVKAYHTSPAAYFGVLLYRSLIAQMEEVPDALNLGVACDSSEDLGLQETMSLITRFLHVVVTKEESALPDEELCQKARSLMKAQMDPAIMTEILKKEKQSLIEMETLPDLKSKAAYYMQHSILFDLVPSVLVSYLGKFELGELEDYMITWNVGGVSFGRGIAIVCIKDLFEISFFHQKKENDPTVQAFQKAIGEAGIPVEVDAAVPQNNVGLVFPE